ncbi:MAG: EamA/RhaT family transporter, partial [Proteobacteria bacterium]|nr:EamA/RhaT family transporter [Pseudomonadota bacterium]
MNARQVGYYVALALIWGVSFTLIVRVVAVFGWVGAVSLRAFAACVILGVLAFATRRKLDFGGAWRPLAIVGSTTVAGQLLGLSYAAPRIGTAMAAIIVGTIPLFSMVIG